MSASLTTKVKDPQEQRVFTFDWTSHIGTDTIASETTTVPSGITKVTSGIVSGAKKTSVTLSGGTAGENYEITCTVVLTGGETLERTGTVAVRHL